MCIYKLTAQAGFTQAGLSIIDFYNNGSALVIAAGATVTLKDSRFARNELIDNWVNGAVIAVTAKTPNNRFGQDQYSLLRLENCDFSGNNATHDLVGVTQAFHAGFDVRIYSDIERKVAFPWEKQPVSKMYTLGEEVFGNQYDDSIMVYQEVTLPLEQAESERPGIDAYSPWFVKVQQARLSYSSKHVLLYRI